MELLHLTPTSNINSIMKYGLLPTKVKLEHHLDAFNEDGLHGEKCIYTWDPDTSCNTDKVIRDFIYCKLFIHPRNQIADDNEKENERRYYDEPDFEWGDDKNWFDFTTLGSKLYGEDEHYTLLRLNSDDMEIIPHSYGHIQASDGDKNNSCVCMDKQYEHDDKMLYIGKSLITPDKLEIIGGVQSRVYKNDTIGINYTKMFGR